MIKNLQRVGIMLICFLLVFGTMLGQKTMAASQQPGDQHSVIPNEPITGAAYGNDVYVAVGYYGKILTSGNGFDWQIAADKSRLDVTYTGVAYGNNQFVAVGDQGTVMTSPDGNTWTQRDSTISSRIDRVAYAGNSINKFFAVTTAGKVITSTDGIAWSSMTIGAGNNNLTSIAVSDTAIVIGDSGGNVHTSTNGSTWSAHKKLDNSFFINSVLSLNNRFYANDALGWSYTSGDGSSWEKLGAPFKTSDATPNQIFGGLYDGSNYYLFGWDGSSYGGIFKSTDGTGTNFQQQAKGSTMTAQNAFYAKGVYMQLGNDGIVVSTNGTTWQYPYGGSFANVIYDGTRYLAVGRNGNDGFIKGSTDGINWSKVNLNLVPALTSIVYANGKYVAVGDAGTVATSSDGTNWTVNPTAISDYKLTSVTYGNGVLIAVDEIGTIYKSTNNGVNWLPPVREDTVNYNALQFVSYTNGKFYAVGDYDTYLESTNGDAWQPVASAAVPSAAFFNINISQQTDIPVTLTNTLKSISVGNRGTVLIQDTDFTVSGSVVTLKKEMLSQLAEGWQTFTFHSSNGASQTFAVNVKNTSSALGQAANVKLSKDGIATWSPVSGAAGYEVQLYRNGSVWGSAVSTNASTLSADFLTAMRSAGVGSYSFKVKAKGNTVNYKDGQQSDASSPVVIYKAPTEDGTANKEGTFQNAKFSINVNALNGAIVTAKVGTLDVLEPSSVTSVTAGANGKASLPIDITKLTEGINNVVIAFTVGNDSFSEDLTVSLTKDTIVPPVPTEDGTADKAGTIQNSNFSIVVNAENDALVTANVGGTNVLQAGTTIKAANGKATLPIDLSKLAESNNQIVIVVTDVAGNPSAPLTVPVTKDTIAPIKPVEDGTADKANTTQNTNFDIIVTAENGTKVTAKVGGTNVLQSGTEVTVANNKAVLPIDVTKLAENANSIVIVAKDAVGNTSASLTIIVNKDTNPPNTPTEDGTANKAGTTQNANFNIIVNAETGSAVTAKVAGVNVLQSGASVTAVAGKATLPIDFTKFTEGPNAIEVVATDAIGNASGILNVGVTIDTIAPTDPTEDGTAPVAGTIQNANFTIIVNAETGAAVTAKVGGANVLQSGTSVIAANGKAPLPIDISLLAEGTNNIEVVVTDGMGAASGILTVAMTKDTSPPAVPVEDGTADKANTTQNTNFDIIVTAENGTKVTAKVGGTNVLHSGTEVTVANNKAVLPIDVTKLAENANSIVIVAKDAVGNTSTDLTITVNKDTSQPSAPTEDGTANKAGTTQNANFNIIVNAETGSAVTAKVAGVNVLQSGASVTAVTDKATLPIDFTKLAEGPNAIEIVATDAIGNASSILNVAVTIDTIAPTDPTEDGTAPVAGTIQNANFTIIVNAETGAAVTAKVVGANVLQSGTSVIAANGKAPLPIDISLLAEGANNIEVVVTDGMGAASGILTVGMTKDTSPPAVPVEDGTADKDNTSQTDNFNIIVATETGAMVTAKVGSTNVLQSGTNVTAVGGKAILPIDLSKLAMGDNEIAIVATDAIGNSSISLTVKVTRDLSSNADLIALAVSSGNLTFAADTTSYTLSVANNVETMTVTPTTADTGASVMVNNVTVVSGHSSTDIPLSVGMNHIKVVVTAVNHAMKTYTIDVTRISNNALLADLSVDQGKLTPDFSNSQLNYQVEVPNTVSGLNMSLEKAEPNETVTVTGATYSTVTGNVYTYSVSNLNVGSNTISIVVTAQDGTTSNTYSLTIERAPIVSGNADLSSLILSSGALTPVFTSGEMSYTANVANGISSLTVTGSLDDSHSTMTVNGTAVLSGQTSGNINLTVGTNTITIIVTAQDGTTTKTYTITVNRAAQENTDQHEHEHDDAGNGGSATSDPSSVVGTNGQLTLLVGQSGEVSLGEAVSISIPAGAAMKELKLSIEKLVNTQNLISAKDVLLSPIFEILKNFSENFSKPVTLSFAFNPSAVQKDQKPSVFYFDEVHMKWVEVAGGTVNGNRITVAVDHFTKYAVFAVGQSEPTKDSSGNPAFRDITGHWAEVNIKNAVNGGIVSGYPDGTFKPDSTVTRAEFAVMLMNAWKLQGEGAQLTFTDNAKIGAWAQQAIAKAVKAGIIHGYEDGSFRPDAQITRAEMAVIIANAMGASTTGATATGFSDDETIPAWAKGSVAFVKQAGIVQGRDKNAFAPQANATRAESVVVLLKALERKNK